MPAPDLALTLLANGVFGALAWRVGGVSMSGAVAGALIGSMLVVGAGWPAWFMLALTFVVATGTTRIGAATKRARAIHEQRGGRRAAGNVIANTGVAALWALAGAWTSHEPLAAIGIAAALATAASDTAASEIGKATGGRTWRVFPFREVPSGTNGAISAAGSVAGLISAVVLSVAALGVGLVVTPGAAAAVALSAVAAFHIESVIAVTLEDTGWLGNNGVNFLSSAIGSAIAVGMA